jgi:disulfide bond formation protein DsbB
MSANQTVILAGAYSLAMILGTQFFQYVVGVPPCEMCYWQRWPLEVAIVLCFGGAGLFAAGIIGRQAIAALAWIALILIAATGVIGAYQAGVEWKFLPGPTSCTGARFEFHGAADLVNAAPVVRCDEASWRLFGISLAGYNAVFSLGAAGLGAYLLSIKKTFLLRRRR